MKQGEPDGRALLEALTDAVIVVEEASGLILDANSASVQTYGYAREELLGQHVSALASVGEPRSPVVHRRKDATTFPVEVSTSVMDWAGRKVKLHVVRDVSLIASAFHGSPLLLAVSDLVNDRYLEVNDAFCTRVGFSREEIVGRTAVELGLIDAQERDQLAKRLMAALPNACFEMVIRSRAGLPIICKYWGRVLHTAGGPRLFAVAEDITERKRADEALEKSETRFELAMDATSDGLWDWDITTDTVYFSPGYYRMLGYEADSFGATGRSWSELIHPDDRAAAVQANQDCIHGRRERFEVEFRMKSKGGEWRWILGRGKCVARDRGGRALRLVGTHVDLTERRRLEARLAQSDRLTSMGMLAAGLAHEINNPLSYVLASLDALTRELPRLEGLGDARLADLVDSAQSALDGTRRIRKISRSLGAFSRADRFKLNNIDLSQTLETAATMAHNEVKYRATLIKELGQVPAVLASEGKLAQVFLNVLINAAHAISEGHVERNQIIVRTWAAGRDVFAEVADTGQGIPPENLERIFEPFFTTKPLGVGSGLGLSISRNIVTEFGGDIAVQSEVGKGTRVTVRLPASTVAVSVPQVRVTQVSSVNQPESVLRGRILVVDDEPILRRVLARILGQRHEVVVAASGREAKAVLERDEAFDVILCDVMMPELTGVDLHAWLVGHSPRLAHRLVFISGGAFTPSTSDYLATVGNLRVDKPFDTAQLLELMTRLVSTARGEPAAAGP